MKEYYDRLKKEADKAYGVAKKAREKGLDPTEDIEIPKAKDLAARVEGLVEIEGIKDRIRELQEEDMDREEIEFQIIKDIVEGKYGENDSKEEKISKAVRTALSIEVEGVTVAGTEGISDFKIKKNQDGSTYLSTYFAGPIRSAGATSEVKAVIFSDYARKLLDIGRFKATEEQTERYSEEVEMYHNQVSRLQFHPSEEEVKKIVRNCPVCIDGRPTEQIEVKANKNIEGIETNRLRGGMCLVLAEGVAQKKKKALKTTQKHNIGWEWLEELIEVKKKDKKEEKEEKKELKPNEKFLANVVGGRPVFSYPMKEGGFRLRYGRSRNNGIAAKSIHPATMEILDRFTAIGTQIKVERPGKAASVTPCDTIEPPIVKLDNGNVVKVETAAQAREIEGKIDEVLFLGDILVTFGDFLDSNHNLVPSGICEEWWHQLAEEKDLEIKDPYDVSSKEALRLSKEKDLPMHPKYTYHYKDINKKELNELRTWLKENGDFSKYESFDGEEVLHLSVDNFDKKHLLEKICIPHEVDGGTIKIENGQVLVETLGIDKELDSEKLMKEAEDTIDFVNKLSNFPVYDKAPVYVGSRMGRPEKAKARKMSPAPHGLVPVGEAGGNQRLITKAAEQDAVKIEKALLYCPECGKELFAYKCPDCGEKAVLKRICGKCGRIQKNEKCDSCGGYTRTYHNKMVNMKEELERSVGALKEKTKERSNTIRMNSNSRKNIPKKIKGVKGTTNADHVFEPLEKALLRAKHNLSVFMDGTIRYDAIDIPLTHFKPSEIGVSVEKLRELGYRRDHKGNKLKKEDQTLELRPNDILIPEEAVEHVMNTTKFIDELLEKYYDIGSYYDVEKKEDLVGILTMGLAPHTSVGVISRIIGFSRARGGFAHPYFHCAKRRNCDGDEDSFMLLLDALLNFSRRYLPDRPGGAEDAPLVLSTEINPSEIDDEVHAMETVYKYPLEFYEEAEKMTNPRDIEIDKVEDRLGTGKEFSNIGFTHDTTQFDEGPVQSSYTTLKAMQEKVDKQMELGKRIRAVDEKDMATKLINLHFMKDIYGNLRAFGQQTFRCVDCNTKFRRVPLIGKCTECGGKILLTVHEKGIEKYLKISREIANKYELSDYLKQRLDLIEQDLEQIFKTRKVTQRSLADF